MLLNSSTLLRQFFLLAGTPAAISALQANQHLCYEAKLTPFRGSDGKMSGRGSGTATIHIDPEHLSYTRTIVFTGLSTPTDEGYVHVKLMNLPNFPVNVFSGTYTQTFPESPLHANYFKNLEAKYVNIFLALNDNDILYGSAYLPCKEDSPSKSLRGSA